MINNSKIIDSIKLIIKPNFTSKWTFTLCTKVKDKTNENFKALE